MVSTNGDSRLHSKKPIIYAKPYEMCGHTSLAFFPIYVQTIWNAIIRLWLHFCTMMTFYNVLIYRVTISLDKGWSPCSIDHSKELVRGDNSSHNSDPTKTTSI